MPLVPSLLLPSFCRSFSSSDHAFNAAGLLLKRALLLPELSFQNKPIWPLLAFPRSPSPPLTIVVMGYHLLK